MNEKFKLIMTKTSGDGTKTFTESHPKLTASDVEFAAVGDALTDNVEDYEFDHVNLVSETTVYTAE